MTQIGGGGGGGGGEGGGGGGGEGEGSHVIRVIIGQCIKISK